MEYKNNDDLAQELIRLYGKLKERRIPYEKMWDELTDYVLSSVGTKTHHDMRFDPERKSRKRLNSAPGVAARMLKAKIIAEMTGPGTRWFELRDSDPVRDKQDNIRRVLQAATDKLFQVLNDDSFQMAHTEATMDWVVYGTACLLAEKDNDNQLFFRAVPIHHLWLEENYRGEVDMVFRKFTMTHRQLCQHFGEENVPEACIKESMKEPLKEFEVLHCVMPNDDYDSTKKRNKNFKFRSVYILLKHQTILKEGFYKNQPYIVFRFWKRSSEVYGGSPAVDALPDIRLLNALEETYLRICQLNAAPPLLVAHDSVVVPLKVVPNGVNYGGMSEDGKKLIGELFERPRSENSIKELIENKIMHIRSAFFVDPLINRENSIRTAAEVSKRSNEEMVGITPFLSRYKVEYLTPVIGQVLQHLLSERIIEFPPEVLQRLPELDFSAPLAKTQRSQELNNLIQFGQLLQMVGQIDPSVLKNVDFNEYLRTVADLLSAPMEVIRSPEEMDAMAKQEQQAQQISQVGQAAQGGGDLLANLAKSGLVNRSDIGLPEPAEGFN